MSRGHVFGKLIQGVNVSQLVSNISAESYGIIRDARRAVTVVLPQTYSRLVEKCSVHVSGTFLIAGSVAPAVPMGRELTGRSVAFPLSERRSGLRVAEGACYCRSAPWDAAGGAEAADEAASCI